MVVDPTLVGPDKNIRFTRSLIDGGSSINLMYRHTMEKLNINPNMLESTRTTFHGIVPGAACVPMGRVRVDVIFGTKESCRVENIEFEVVDLPSQYHIILGRPALHKFMASTHMSYLKMKMPGPNGVITIAGNYKRSMECASAGSALAESLVIAEETKRINEVKALADSARLAIPDTGNPSFASAFMPAKETKSVSVDDDFPDRTVVIGAGLTDK